MNAQSTIGLSRRVDVNLTEIMRREHIAKVELYPGRFSVVLIDGSLGIGATVGEALEKAKAPGAQNVRRMA